MSEKKRCFVCIDFPDEIIKEIRKIQQIINKKPFTGKITAPENLHLTLKFLGEIPEEKIKQTTSLLSKLSFPTLNLKLENSGYFSYNNNPKIIWIKIAGKDIFNLQKQIDKILKPIFPEEKRFMLHLTIARIKYVKDKSSFKTYIENIKPKKLKFQTNSFKLKSSQLTPQGPIYTTIKEFQSN